jgi:hypothetical protein
MPNTNAEGVKIIPRETLERQNSLISDKIYNMATTALASPRLTKRSPKTVRKCANCGYINDDVLVCAHCLPYLCLHVRVSVV